MSIVFWSGGKDSYLALKYYLKSAKDRPTLLTTYENSTGLVPYQNIEIETIKNQAETLGLPILPIGIPTRATNEQYLTTVSKAIQDTKHDRLVFGDWHLEDIRMWREQQFGDSGLGYNCHFPIWKKPFEELLSFLETLPVNISISGVDILSEGFVKIGETYNRAFVEKLPDRIDPMGENGEFHTIVAFD